MATARTRKSPTPTPVPVRFGAEDRTLYRIIAARARAQSRSVSGQVKYYARLGQIAEDNADLPLSFIKGILEAQAELEAGLGQPYQWGVLNGHSTAQRAEGPKSPETPGGEIGGPVPRRRVIQPEDGE